MGVDREVKVNYYICVAEHEIDGVKWLVLKDGKTILVAKRWSLLRLTEDKYSLLYDSEGKTKVVVHKDKDIDVVFICRKEVKKLKEQVKNVGMDAHMDAQCESMGNTIPEDKVYRYELKTLERKLNKLEETVNVLSVLCDVLAKNSGVKVETFKGVVVISLI